MKATKTAKLWYLKQRFNPQLGTYWSRCGQLSKTAAKKHEKPLYGSNKMHGFETGAAYLAKIEELKRDGERVY